MKHDEKRPFPLPKSLFIAGALALLCLQGCAHSVHQVSVSGYEPYSTKSGGKEIKAESEQFVILSFITQNDYVDLAYNQLTSQCKDGDIVGITTQYSTSLGFFSWHNKIKIRGLCIKG